MAALQSPEPLCLQAVDEHEFASVRQRQCEPLAAVQLGVALLEEACIHV